MTPREKLDDTYLKAKKKTAEMLSIKIGQSTAVTQEYQKFCLENDVSLQEGAYLDSCPWPFPMNDPVQCPACFEVYEQKDIDNALLGEFFVEVVPADRQGPAEYEERCPACYYQDDEIFIDVDCPVCGCYPCCCAIDEFKIVLE